MLAYKKLIFDFYPSLRDGKFLGVLVSSNELEKASAKLDLLLNKIEQDINYKIDMLQQEMANVSRIIKMKEHIYSMFKDYIE